MSAGSMVTGLAMHAKAVDSRCDLEEPKSQQFSLTAKQTKVENCKKHTFSFVEKKRFYLTKFLLNVGVDIDVIHTVRHFPLATSSGEPQTMSQTGRRTTAPAGVREYLHRS